MGHLDELDLVPEQGVGLTGDDPGGRGRAVHGAVHRPAPVRHSLVACGPVLRERLQGVLPQTELRSCFAVSFVAMREKGRGGVWGAGGREAGEYERDSQTDREGERDSDSVKKRETETERFGKGKREGTVL